MQSLCYPIADSNVLRSNTFDSSPKPTMYYDQHAFPNSRQNLDFSGTSTPGRSSHHSPHIGQSPSSSGYSGSHSHTSGAQANSFSPQHRETTSYHARNSQVHQGTSGYIILEGCNGYLVRVSLDCSQSHKIFFHNAFLIELGSVIE